MSNAFGNNTFLDKECPTNDTDDVVDPIFGIYLPAIQNVSESTNFFEKLFYCFWWGLQSLRFVKKSKYF
jgi:cyclic nucleotide gated channel, plant